MLIQSHIQTLARLLIHSLTLPQGHHHPDSRTHSLPPFLNLSLPRSLTRFSPSPYYPVLAHHSSLRTQSVIHYLIQSFTTYSLTTLTHSLTKSLSHSPTHSITHSLHPTHLLSHLFDHSLTCSPSLAQSLTHVYSLSFPSLSPLSHFAAWGIVDPFI